MVEPKESNEPPFYIRLSPLMIIYLLPLFGSGILFLTLNEAVSMLIDSHCHLNFDAFDEDRAQVVARAKKEGIVTFINPGTNLEDSRQVIALAEEIPELYAAIGVHPNDAAGFDAAALAQLRE